ncbi:hypothetical protein MRX96_008927 [Rhipicephalus microplus]
MSELKEQNGEVIDLSCRVRGIVLSENVGYKLEHLETESHRKKKTQVTEDRSLATKAPHPKFSNEPLKVDSDPK